MKYEQGQVVAHRLARSSRGYEHAFIYRFTGISALHRSGACGGNRVVVVDTRYPPGDISWFPIDDREEVVAADLVRHARQGYLVCKKCLKWAEANK